MERIYFEVISQLEVEVSPRDSASQRVIGVNTRIDCSQNLDRTMYVTKNEMPTRDGVKITTAVLVSALNANIHYAHQAGIKDSAEHLREVIAELERQFVLITSYKSSTLENG